MTRLEKSNLKWGYFFIMPAILGILIFIFGPMLFSIFVSFTSWDMLSPMEWQGLENYRTMFTVDPLYWKSLRVTFYFTLLNVPAVNIFGLILASLLNTKVRGRSLFRTAFYVPSIVPIVANSALWIFMYNPTNGLLNNFIGLFGMEPQKWIGDEKLVIPSLVLMSAWGAGSTMVIYLAGLQGVSAQLYEAADIDGGNALTKFFHITLPILSPIVFFNVVTCLIGSLQVFTQGYVMTQGGPNNGSLFYVLLLYRSAFTNNQMGYACAMAWVLFLFIALLTVCVFKSSSLWVFYENEVQR